MLSIIFITGSDIHIKTCAIRIELMRNRFIIKRDTLFAFINQIEFSFMFNVEDRQTNKWYIIDPILLNPRIQSYAQLKYNLKRLWIQVFNPIFRKNWNFVFELKPLLYIIYIFQSIKAKVISFLSNSISALF